MGRFITRELSWGEEGRGQPARPNGTSSAGLVTLGRGKGSGPRAGARTLWTSCWHFWSNQVFSSLPYWLFLRCGAKREEEWGLKAGDSPTSKMETYSLLHGYDDREKINQQRNEGHQKWQKWRLTTEDFSYFKSQWKIIHSFCEFQTKYTFHPIPHTVCK